MRINQWSSLGRTWPSIHWRDEAKPTDKIKGTQTCCVKGDMNNGIATHAWDKEHRVVWESARVRTVETNYCRRRVSQTLHIKKQDTSNLDCGLHFIITLTNSTILDFSCLTSLPHSVALFCCFVFALISLSLSLTHTIHHHYIIPITTSIMHHYYITQITSSRFN